MAAQYAERIKLRKLLKGILTVFQLQVDDISKPRHPALCTVNLVALFAYHAVSIGLLWLDNDGALISTILNALCVIRGLCKVIFNQQLYRAKVHRAWTNCTQENEAFIKKVCNPYFLMFLFEVVPLILFACMLLAISLDPGAYPVPLVGTLVLIGTFIGDFVDVLTDMYDAYPPMPVLPNT